MPPRPEPGAPGSPGAAAFPGAAEATVMEPGAQVPSPSSSEDEGPPAAGPAPRHSTPKAGAPHWRRRPPPGRLPSRPRGRPAGGPLQPARSPRGLSPPLRKRQLSTPRASEESSGRLGPDSDPQAPAEEPPQRQEPPPGSRPGNVGWPGIQDTARRRSRDAKKLAAVTQRVRQWEARQLQNIEEATQHELVVEDP